MFYEPRNGHDLPHNPFNAIVTPRPIGWISCQDRDGNVNLAPYSFFNATAYTPPQVMFSSIGSKPDQYGTKDSLAAIRDTGEFCVNIVSFALRDAMNASSQGFAKEVNEFERAGLTAAACTVIGCPRVAEAPANLECRLTEVITLEGEANYMVLGEVVGVHMRDEHIVEGRFDVTTFRPLSRLGYRDYACVDNLFSLSRPGEKD